MTDVRSFIEVGPGVKDRLRTAIEALVDVLDSLDPDIDLEDTGDEHEPDADEEESIRRWDAPIPANGFDADRELDTADDEPMLGSIGSCYGQSIPQTEWAGQRRWDEQGRAYPDECEEENEHGGDINDEDQPELGSTHALNQEVAWRATGWWAESHPIGEGEPSLGWSEGRGHPEAVQFGGNDDLEEQHDREHDEAEMGIVDHDALAIERGGEGGGDLPTMDQSVEGVSSILSADRRSVDFATPAAAIAREQAVISARLEQRH